jgi:class 3 adenylate cyclase
MSSDTLTFLFTDIEGSTRRWEHYPQAMQAALARHDTILQNAIQAQGDRYSRRLAMPSMLPSLMLLPR